MLEQFINFVTGTKFWTKILRFFYSNFELQNDINREKIYFNDFPKVVLIWKNDDAHETI